MNRRILNALLFSVLLCCILVSCGKKKIIVKGDLSGGIGELSVDEIWEIDDNYTLVNEMGYYLSKKCNFGEDIQRLSDAERIIYIVYTLEGEVNNGGFSQYFYNSSGDLGHELVSSFESIGAVKNAQICKKATSVFEGEYPKDRMARQAIMTADENEYLGDIWSECDSEFFEYPEDTADMMYKFIMENKKDFS